MLGVEAADVVDVEELLELLVLLDEVNAGEEETTDDDDADDVETDVDTVTELLDVLLAVLVLAVLLLDETVLEERTATPLEYTLSLSLPPQYSDALALQTSLHKLTLAIELLCLYDPAPKELPQ